MLFNNCMIQVVRRVKCICMNENNFGGCMLQITLITVMIKPLIACFALRA